MGATFESAIPVVLKNEGEKFTDIPGDPGGATKWGITLKQALLHGLVENVEGLKQLTEEQAAQFYHKWYWDENYTHLDQSAATKLFDVGVNVSPVHAVQLAQRTINEIATVSAHAKVPMVEVDGHFGVHTMDAITACDASQFLDTYRRLQIKHYTDWVNQNVGARTKFLAGLLNRANSC